ncbi:type II toxin-antitoxin system death-on-curing family toxin [Streptomyces sp. NRRL B-24484]|uniref:type II toxin-antitoxin system death-on-curing family toxin n=1 Tax=Streptomyces sp. NRRL B-24484 TaxID=1463833 RepID=UPI000A45443B
MNRLETAELLELAAFACRGRPAELREPGLLDSAAHRPSAGMFGVEFHPGVFDKAAALLHAVASNHPLVDGNKRTAWMGAVVCWTSRAPTWPGSTRTRRTTWWWPWRPARSPTSG